MKKILFILSVFICSYSFGQVPGKWAGDFTSKLEGKTWNLDSAQLKIRTGLDGIALKFPPINISETSQVNFNLTRIASAQTSLPANEIVNFGFNAAANATPESAGKGAMFWSMESNYIPGSTRLWEWHQEFVNDAGTNRRLSSFTINHSGLANPDIDYYMTASRFYIKSPVSGSVAWQVGDFTNGASVSSTLTTSTWSSAYGLNASGLQIVDNGGTGAGRQFEVDGFGTGNLGAQLGWVAGAQSWVQTGAVGSNPFNLKDGSGHHAYLYNNGANGSIILSNSGAGNYPTIISNSTSSTADYAMYNALNDLGAGAYMFQSGSTYVGAGVMNSNWAIFRGTGAKGMMLVADNATGEIKFVTGTSFSERAKFTNGGHLLINTTTDAATLSISGSEAHGYRAITALRTLDATDHIINCTSGSFTVTLPTAVGITGREYIIKNTGSATTITIATTSSQTIDGSAPGTVTTLVPLRVVSDGANWITF